MFPKSLTTVYQLKRRNSIYFCTNKEIDPVLHKIDPLFKFSTYYSRTNDFKGPLFTRKDQAIRVALELNCNLVMSTNVRI